MERRFTCLRRRTETRPDRHPHPTCVLLMERCNNYYCCTSSKNKRHCFAATLRRLQPLYHSFMYTAVFSTFRTRTATNYFFDWTFHANRHFTWIAPTSRSRCAKWLMVALLLLLRNPVTACWTQLLGWQHNASNTAERVSRSSQVRCELREGEIMGDRIMPPPRGPANPRKKFAVKPGFSMLVGCGLLIE